MFESIVHLPLSFATFQDLFHSPTMTDIARVFLRWAHFVAGITWIGMLYFFNLVNVNFMKALDGPTKKVVVPALMPPALWYFRWGAVVTVLAGLTYYAMYILSADAHNAGVNVWIVLVVWLLIGIITWLIYFLILPMVAKDGRVVAAVVIVLAIGMSAAIIWWLNSQLGSYGSNKSFSIGIGGAMGLIMLLNVWGIIWPAQKRIIAGTISGDPAPPELARKAFLASRTNAWLSLPMLFFMATSHGDYVVFGK
ncbi:MAG: urate hydroxylase PuuD [Pyrinomonadaceae bacterium]